MAPLFFFRSIISMFWWSPKQSNVFNCEIILSELTVCLETFTSFEDD